MSRETFTDIFALNSENIDKTAENVEKFLLDLGTERANMLRIRLSLEEALFRWKQHFGEGAEVRLVMGRSLLHHVIRLELKGPIFDPFVHPDTEIGDWDAFMLESIGNAIQFQYQHGVNTVRVDVRRKKANPALTMLIAVVLGVAIGWLGLRLPEAVRNDVLRAVLEPVRDVFFRILYLAANPIIFFSLLAIICGMGNFSAMNNSGFHLFVRFLFLSGLCAAGTLLLSAQMFSFRFLSESLQGSHFRSMLDFILTVVPRDLFSPFVDSDSPQIIFMAMILGNALLVAGPRAKKIIRLVRESEVIFLIIAEWVSRSSPFFVTILLVLGIWDGTIRFVLGIWRPFLVFLSLSFAALLLSLFHVSVRENISVTLLARKIRASFLMSFKTASVSTAYEQNKLCCEKKLGIDSHLAAIGIPLGLTVYMPAGTIASMLVTLYAAECYDVRVSFIWYFLAFVMNVTLVAATPPVAGVSLIAYAVMFDRLEIPEEALSMALMADILFGFIVSAVNQAMLQMEMVLEAGRLGLLDRETLRKEEK